MVLLFLKKATKNIEKFANAFSDIQLQEFSWTLILKASTRYYKPELPANADISIVNSIPVLHTRLENAQRTLNQAWIPVISKYSPILIKIIRIAHNNNTYSPIMGCRTILSQSALVKSGHFAVFVLNLRYHLTQFSKDSSESIKIALKTLESKYGRIIYFSSDSGSQLRETLINPTDNRGTPIFSWKSSSRCGPQSQKHNLIESRVSTVKKFAHKIFKNKICKSRQLTELILTIA